MLSTTRLVEARLIHGPFISAASSLRCDPGSGTGKQSHHGQRPPSARSTSSSSSSFVATSPRDESKSPGITSPAFMRASMRAAASAACSALRRASAFNRRAGLSRAWRAAAITFSTACAFTNSSMRTARKRLTR